jgi:hypothetical protein
VLLNPERTPAGDAPASSAHFAATEPFAKRIDKKSLFRGRLFLRISNTGSLAVSKTITKTLDPVQCYIPHSTGPTPL